MIRRCPPTWMLALFLTLAAACTDRVEPGAPGEALSGLSDAEYGRFLLGRAVFEREATEEEGLGPLFNGERCSTCHQTPAIGGSSRVMVLKATRFQQGRCDLLRTAGGDNIQQRATPLLRAAGLGPEAVPSSATHEALLVAPSLFGAGLIEAIPDETLAALADPDDGDGDGISGRVGRGPDGAVGRFGYKAESPDLDHFVDTALRFELGFTTPLHPVEEAVNGQPLPDGVDPMAEPEIDERGVALLTDFVRFLGPALRKVQPPPGADTLRVGRELFESVGCADCHVPELETGASEIEALSRRLVPLYSDLLLHDMGSALEGTCAPGASPTEYRTAPLWGLSAREWYLHDGRTASLEEAVILHGGEAEASRSAFRSLRPEDRRILLRFLESL